MATSLHFKLTKSKTAWKFSILHSFLIVHQKTKQIFRTSPTSSASTQDGTELVKDRLPAGWSDQPKDPEVDALSRRKGPAKGNKVFFEINGARIKTKSHTTANFKLLEEVDIGWYAQPLMLLVLMLLVPVLLVLVLLVLILLVLMSLVKKLLSCEKFWFNSGLLDE